VASLHGGVALPIHSPAAAEVLASGLSTMLDIVRTPLCDAVARLDTSVERWVLYLDSDSPAEDHCWAMLGVLDVLVLGVHAVTDTAPTPRPHPIQD
jgi:hypothetical protein